MRIQIYGWPLAPGDTPATTQEELMSALRQMRDILLKECDWTQTLDCPLSDEIKNDWRIWRQGLRDITATSPSPLPYVVDLGETPLQGRPASWDNWDIDVADATWTASSSAKDALRLEAENAQG